MLQAFIAKKILGSVIKKVMEKREIKKLRKYVEEDNELDFKVKEIEKKLRNKCIGFISVSLLILNDCGPMVVLHE